MHCVRANEDQPHLWNSKSILLSLYKIDILLIICLPPPLCLRCCCYCFRFLCLSLLLMTSDVQFSWHWSLNVKVVLFGWWAKAWMEPPITRLVPSHSSGSGGALWLFTLHPWVLQLSPGYCYNFRQPFSLYTLLYYLVKMHTLGTITLVETGKQPHVETSGRCFGSLRSSQCVIEKWELPYVS